VARAYGHYFPGTRVDAVELDPELTSIGKRYFALNGPRLNVYAADARPWLAASNAHYGAIFLDAYRQPYIPFYLLTHEFFSSIRAHLTPGGVVAVNVGHVPGSDALEKVVTATLHAVFPVVTRDVVSDTNSLVLASTRALTAAHIVAAASALPGGLRDLATTVEGQLLPPLRGGAVYSDDKAPVEWLTDLSIVHYATGGR
jgi:spermidine synthase